MSTKVVVELTPEDEKVLNAFRRVQASDEKTRDGLKQTGEAGEKAAKDLTDAFIKGGKESTGSIDKLMREMKRSGDVGRQVGKQVDEHLSSIGIGGKRSIEQIIESIERLQPEAAEQARAVLAELKEAGEKATFTDALASLRSLGPAGVAAAEQIGGSLKEADRQTDFANTMAKLRAIGPEGEEQAQRIKSGFDKATEDLVFSDALASLKSLGPVGAEAAAEIRGSLDDADRLSDFQRTMTKLMELGPEGQEQADKIRASLEAADQKTSFDRSLAQLRDMGGIGSQIATQLGEEMKQASAAAAGGLEDVLDKIREIKPEVGQSADKIKAELEEAARYGEGKFADTLAELRKLGPTGKAVAEQFKSAMVSEGKIVEQSIDDVIARLHAIDPAAAQAATGIKTNLEDAAKKSDGAFSKFGKSAIGQLASVAGAYVGIQEAIQATTRFLNEQQEVLRKAAERQMDLAGAQQEALKNMAGLSSSQRDGLLEGSVGRIAAEAKFSNLKQLTLAAGAGISAGGTVEQTESAMEASARVTRFTPEAIDEYTAAAIDLARATGSDDAQANLSFLLSSGTQSRIVDPESLAKNLAPAVLNAVQSVPNQDRQQASIEAGALFGVLTQAATDITGQSSATAISQLTAKLDKLFAGREDDTGTLFGRIQAVQNSSGLRDELFDKEFGEERYRGVFKALADGTSQWSKMLMESSKEITTNPELFQRVAKDAETATFAIKTKTLDEAFESNQAQADIANKEGAALQQQRDLVAKLLSSNRGDSGFLPFLASVRDETGIASGFAAPGSTTAEEAVSLIDTIKTRIVAISKDGISDSEVPQIENLKRGEDALIQSLIVRAPDLSPDSFSAAAERADQLAINYRRGGAPERSEAFSTLADDLRNADPASGTSAEIFAKQQERTNELLQQIVESNKQTATNTEPKPQAKPRPQRNVASPTQVIQGARQ